MNANTNTATERQPLALDLAFTPFEIERWAEVKDFPRYQVSTLGRVKSLVFGREKILKQGRSGTGYLMVSLSKDNRCHSKYVHHLVAEAFCEGYGKMPLVRHLDMNQLNNHAANLCPGTYSENAMDEVRAGRHYQTKKTHCVHGHAFTPENTYRYNTHRRCRACARARRQGRA